MDQRFDFSPSTSVTPLFGQEEKEQGPNRRGQLASCRAMLEFILFLAFLAGLNFAFFRVIWFGLRKSDGRYTKLFDCDPNGDFWAAGGNFHNFMDAKYTFAIAYGFGHYSYMQAKVIDVCWDLFVGHGLQTMFGYLVYLLCRRSMRRDMQMRQVSYDAFIAGQYSTTTMPALWSYVKDMFHHCHHTSLWIGQGMLIILTLYVLSMPLWLGAMTGYQPRMAPHLENDHWTFNQFDNLTLCDYAILDGQRIGLAANSCIAEPSAWIDGAEQCKFTSSKHIALCRDLSFTDVNRYMSSSVHNLSDSVFNAPNKSYALDPPLLKIFSADEHPMYHYKGNDRDIFDKDFLMRHGVCNPLPEYMWGFSFHLTAAFIQITFNMILLLLLSWRDPFHKRSAKQPDQVFGQLRAAVQVARSLREQTGIDVDGLSEKELRSRVKAYKAGMRQVRRDDEILGL